MLVFLAETIGPVIPPIAGLVIMDPLATSHLLAQALLTASDFFIQYIILDSLTHTAFHFLESELFRVRQQTRIFHNTPRKFIIAGLLCKRCTEERYFWG